MRSLVLFSGGMTDEPVNLFHMKFTKLSFFIGLLFTGLVLIDLILWKSTWSDSRSYEENNTLYLSKFPGFLQNGQLITVINLVLLGISGFVFWKAWRVKYCKTISMILLVLVSVMFLWMLFALG